MTQNPNDLGPLLSSPLSDNKSTTGGPLAGWWPAVAGVAVGAIAIVAGFWVAQSSDQSTTTTAPVTTATAAPSTITMPAADNAAFPPDYQPVTDFIALKPVSALEAHDTLFVTISTAVRRGLEPSESAPFQSGRWTLETSTGETLTSAGTATDMTVPGTFSIVFPLQGQTGIEPTLLRLEERWQRQDQSESLNLEDVELPYQLPGPIDVAIGPYSLRIDSLTLDSERGEMQWIMSDDRLATVQIWLTLGDPFQPTSFYRSTDSLGFGVFGPSVFTDPQGTTGTVELTPEPGIPDSEPNGQATLDLHVTTITPLPGDAEFDLSQLNIDRPE